MHRVLACLRVSEIDEKRQELGLTVVQPLIRDDPDDDIAIEMNGLGVGRRAVAGSKRWIVRCRTIAGGNVHDLPWAGTEEIFPSNVRERLQQTRFMDAGFLQDVPRIGAPDRGEFLLGHCPPKRMANRAVPVRHSSRVLAELTPAV